MVFQVTGAAERLSRPLLCRFETRRKRPYLYAVIALVAAAGIEAGIIFGEGKRRILQSGITLNKIPVGYLHKVIEVIDNLR